MEITRYQSPTKGSRKTENQKLEASRTRERTKQSETLPPQVAQMYEGFWQWRDRVAPYSGWAGPLLRMRNASATNSLRHEGSPLMPCCCCCCFLLLLVMPVAVPPLSTPLSPVAMAILVFYPLSFVPAVLHNLLLCPKKSRFEQLESHSFSYVPCPIFAGYFVFPISAGGATWVLSLSFSPSQ